VILENEKTSPVQHDWNHHWEVYTEATEHNPGQRYRRRIVREFLERFGCSGSARILDIGSGQGDLALDLQHAFPQAEIAGLELSDTGVRISTVKAPTARFFQRDLLQNLGHPGPLSRWAQYAVCAEVLEHLDDPGLFLDNTAAYLAAGCTLVVTVPGGPQSEFDRYIGHRRHYAPRMLSDLLESRGYRVVFATTAGFPFFNLYRLLVILRGRRLINDVSTASPGGTSSLARAAMAIFHRLFALNVIGTRLGWQTIAVARWEENAGGGGGGRE